MKRRVMCYNYIFRVFQSNFFACEGDGCVDNSNPPPPTSSGDHLVMAFILGCLIYQ